VDHANCEKKAASTAMALIFAYPEDRSLDVPHLRLKPGRYASELRKLVRTHEPKRKLDLMIVHALIEARSCERFRLLSAHLPAEVRELYAQLERSEARHFEMYLNFAEREFEGEEIAVRLETIATREAQLATEPDAELRFHSGPPA
jgi:tRNA-(ms[2]io[6]A)-hydroxylase